MSSFLDVEVGHFMIGLIRDAVEFTAYIAMKGIAHVFSLSSSFFFNWESWSSSRFHLYTNYI